MAKYFLVVLLFFVSVCPVQAATMIFFKTETDRLESMLLIAADGKIYQRTVGKKDFKLFRSQLPNGIKSIEILARKTVNPETNIFQTVLFVIGSDGQIYVLQEASKEFEMQNYTFPEAKAEPEIKSVPMKMEAPDPLPSKPKQIIPAPAK